MTSLARHGHRSELPKNAVVRGKIMGVREDGTYDILDDGDGERGDRGKEYVPGRHWR